MPEEPAISCILPLASGMFLMLRYGHDGWRFAGWRRWTRADDAGLPLLTDAQRARRFAHETEALVFFRDLYRASCEAPAENRDVSGATAEGSGPLSQVRQTARARRV